MSRLTVAYIPPIVAPVVAVFRAMVVAVAHPYGKKAQQK
jgi:hypothetical protein